ncbi:hypothetical protein OHS81_34475 [Streptomyces sp. NBC_00400]
MLDRRQQRTDTGETGTQVRRYEQIAKASPMDTAGRLLPAADGPEVER